MPIARRSRTSVPRADAGPARRSGPGDIAAEPADFDPVAALDDLLDTVGLSRAQIGGSVDFEGRDPILPAALRLGACIGVPLMAAAVAATAFHRQRGGPAQDLDLDLRQAVHSINPGAFWRPTLNGEPAPHPLLLDNPFTVVPYATRHGRWVMASAVYPHQVAAWCRFLDVPPATARVAAAVAAWDADELEEAASAAGLPISMVRSPGEWLDHEQGALLAAQPPIGLERIGDAPVRDFGHSARPFDDTRVLSFTHAVAGPAVGRTLAEQGADVLGVTRPNDYEHEFIYAEANVGSRSAYVDLDRPEGRDRAEGLLADADVVVHNYRQDSLERRGLNPHTLADRHPGVVVVTISCYGRNGPWAGRGGFDMNGSASVGADDDRRVRSSTQAARHLAPQRLHHRLPGGRRGQRRAGQACDRGGLVARHGQPHPDGHVVWLARARRPRARRVRSPAQPARACSLRRTEPARGRPHARPARAVFAHAGGVARSDPRSARFKPAGMVPLTRRHRRSPLPLRGRRVAGHALGPGR